MDLITKDFKLTKRGLVNFDKTLGVTEHLIEVNIELKNEVNDLKERISKLEKNNIK